MDECIEYRANIKSVVKKNYEKELKELELKKVYMTFYDKVIYQRLKDNFIYITDFKNLEESMKKIYYYIKILEKKCKIVDIFIFKMQDTVNYSDGFLASFFCVNREKYEAEIEKYNRVFLNNIQNVENLKICLKRYVENKKKYLVEFNSMEQFDTDISQVYGYMARQTMEFQEKIQEELRENRRKVDNRELQYDINDSNIIRDVFIENTGIEEELEKEEDIIDDKKYLSVLREKKKIYLRKTKNKILRKEIFTKKNYRAIFIIYLNDIDKTKEYVKELIKMDICCIVLNKNIENTINVKNIYDSIMITKGNVVALITDKIIKCNLKNIIKIEDEWNSEKEELIDYFANKSEYLKIFSNLDNINSIKALTTTFFDYNGTNYYAGGAERYLIDLYDVCKDIGYKLRIYQKSNYNFVRKYKDIEVVGISNNEDYIRIYKENKKIEKKYREIASETTKLTIYSDFLECIEKNQRPSVGISHGIAWDNPDNIYKKSNGYVFYDKSWIIDAAQRCNKIISVDNNTANYFQTVDYKLGNTTEVIPNYVNVKEFYPVRKKKGKIVILYPRRLYAPRGLYMVLNIIDKLFEKYNNVEIRFVGKGLEEDIQKIEEKVKKWGKEKIKVYSKEPSEMHNEYKKADITVIPTLYSEGTSLSCLEAMASGNAVIATRVGGLTDLVINNYNGKLIEPNENALYEAIEEFLNNKKLVKKCKRNAIEVAKTFSKEEWKLKWKKAIKQLAKENDKIENIEAKTVMIHIDKTQSVRENKIILEYLIKGYIVYVVSSENINRKSCGRLQYINEEDELYFKPDVIFTEKI